MAPRELLRVRMKIFQLISVPINKVFPLTLYIYIGTGFLLSIVPINGIVNLMDVQQMFMTHREYSPQNT